MLDVMDAGRMQSGNRWDGTRAGIERGRIVTPAQFATPRFRVRGVLWE